MSTIRMPRIYRGIMYQRTHEIQVYQVGDSIAFPLFIKSQAPSSTDALTYESIEPY